jgi:hypothetical protein
LIGLAVGHADSEDAARIAGTPYAVALTMTLADIARRVEELKVDLKAGRSLAVRALLKCIDDASASMMPCCGVRNELDFAGDSPASLRSARLRCVPMARSSNISIPLPALWSSLCVGRCRRRAVPTVPEAAARFCAKGLWSRIRRRARQVGRCRGQQRAQDSHQGLSRGARPRARQSWL